jgi:hybrid cluster-associated redox disulfide protein
MINMAVKKITKDMTFAQVLQKHPETAQVFLEKGMHCIGCMAAHFESIEQGATAHGIDVKSLIEDLNKAVEKKAKKQK